MPFFSDDYFDGSCSNQEGSFKDGRSMLRFRLRNNFIIFYPAGWEAVTDVVCKMKQYFEMLIIFRISGIAGIRFIEHGTFIDGDAQGTCCFYTYLFIINVGDFPLLHLDMPDSVIIDDEEVVLIEIELLCTTYYSSVTTIMIMFCSRRNHYYFFEVAVQNLQSPGYFFFSAPDASPFVLPVINLIPPVK